MSSKIIPIFQMASNYVYFKDLMNTENNSPWIALQKRALYHAAENKANNIASKLSEPERINNAIKFIQQVAANERDKELMAIKNYCQKLHKKYPSFLNKSVEEIYNKPDEFYIELTEYLNKAKQGAREYKKELQRIRENAGLVEKEWKKKNRSQYSDDNYLYNLQSDIKSLLTKLIGTFQGSNKSADAFTNKVQAAVMQILDKFDIPNHMQKGEDFAAIAAGVLIDFQKHLQAQFDDERAKQQIEHNRTLAEAMKPEINSMVDKYIKEVEAGENLSSVQTALKDITSIRGNHIIQEMKNGLGIKSITTVNELAKRVETINAVKKKTKYRKKEYKQMIDSVVGNITNPALLETLPRLTFTDFDKRTGHGDIAELVSSALQYNKNLGFYINPKVGADIMEFHVDYDIKDPTTESVIKIMRQIDKDFTAFERKTHTNEDSSMRDLEPAVHSLNLALQKSNAELDELLHNIENEEQFFVYHTSQKLHSSVETGKSLGFKGRDNLNILSGLDSIYSALQTAGLATPAMKEELRFLALNLAPSAAGSDAIGPVENYLSKFAGLLMFDDVDNMVQETLNQIEYTNLNVIHIYKLNDIYVPASMLLTYISDEIEKASEFALEDIAKVEINTTRAENTIQSWLTDYHQGKIQYSMEEWRRVANGVASKTQIKITLMAAFLKFIENLWK